MVKCLLLTKTICRSDRWTIHFLLDAMDWSYSRVSSFDQCPHMFNLTYLQCKDRVENAFAQWGSLGHSLLERYFRQQFLSGSHFHGWRKAITSVVLSISTTSLGKLGMK